MAELPGNSQRAQAPAEPGASLLAEALRAGDEDARLRAARALREHSGPEAVGALVAALDDENAGVRWMAGEALVHIGAPAVEPLLHCLVGAIGNVWLYEEAEYVLSRLQLPQFGGAITPVVDALRHTTSRDVEVPVKAELALQQIAGSSQSPG